MDLKPFLGEDFVIRMNPLQTACSSMRLTAQPGFYGLGIEAHELANLHKRQADISEIGHITAAALDEFPDIKSCPESFRRQIGLRRIAHAFRYCVNPIAHFPYLPAIFSFATPENPLQTRMTGHDNQFARGCKNLPTGEISGWNIQEKKPKLRQASSSISSTHNLKVVGSNPAPATTLRALQTTICEALCFPAQSLGKASKMHENARKCA